MWPFLKRVAKWLDGFWPHRPKPPTTIPPPRINRRWDKPMHTRPKPPALKGTIFDDESETPVDGKVRPRHARKRPPPHER